MNKQEELEKVMVKSLHALVEEGELQVCFSKDRSDRKPYYFLTGHDDKIDWTKFDKIGT